MLLAESDAFGEGEEEVVGGGGGLLGGGEGGGAGGVKGLLCVEG